jgi:hypothetical protein
MKEIRGFYKIDEKTFLVNIIHCYTIIVSLHIKKEQLLRAALFYLPGDVLLSQGESPQLPSALKSLTSVFGMGTGVTSSP